MTKNVRKHISEIETANKYAGLNIQPTDRIHITTKEKIGHIDKQQQGGYKPNGFWYGFGFSWIHWVQGEMPEWEYPNVFKIDVKENSILQIKTVDALMQFHEKYKIPINGMDTSLGDQWNFYIDWRQVGRDYVGIEINPYQYSLRHELMWSYGWDTESGCVWNSVGIEHIERLK